MSMWRPSRPEDDLFIERFFAAFYEEDPAPRPVPSDHLRRTLRELREQPARGLALVLEVDGQPQGYALLCSYWSNELGGEICTIDELYVAPPARGHRLGTALLESLVRGDGPWPGRPVALELEVSPQNHRARALYERLGFAGRRNATLRLLLD
jgi:GNAT superfamily N-acetyltransferase